MIKKTKIFIAGDSTAASKQLDKRPETGWGEMISLFFKDNVEFYNYAYNGRSTKSFIEEGRLDEIASHIEKGDFLFIQFGHNDAKADMERHTDPFTTYKSYLLKYIEVALEAGANPVLLTSIQRREFSDNKTLRDTHGDYPKAMREVAEKYGIMLIDMQKKSHILLEKLGDEKSKEIYLWLNPGQSENYPNGISDNTHFNGYGAKQIAGLVVEGIIENNMEPLSKFIVL